MNASILSLVALVTVTTWSNGLARAEDKGAKPAPTKVRNPAGAPVGERAAPPQGEMSASPEMKAMMEKAQKNGSPGAGHEALKPLIGQWTTANTMWMKPGDKPEKSTGSSTFEWVLGGRFVRQTYKGTAMGQPFEGMGYLGYDNVKKQYQSVWMDTMTTGLMASTSGQFDKATKTLKEEGSYSCPMTEVKDTWYRSELKMVSKDKNIFSWYTKDPSGKEFKSMEIVYTRAK